MSELQVEWPVLATVADSFRAEGSAVAHVATVVDAALHAVTTALPGSRSAPVAESLGLGLSGAIRLAAAELSTLSAALSVAAGEYAAVDHQTTAAGLERAGRRPA